MQCLSVYDHATESEYAFVHVMNVIKCTAPQCNQTQYHLYLEINLLKCTVVLCLKRDRRCKKKGKQAQKMHTDLIIYTELALFNQIDLICALI